MKILALDIETAPCIAHVWGLWKQNVGLNQIKETVKMICYVAKWIGGEEIVFRKEGDVDYLQKVWNLLDEADVVLHYNGKNFDIPHLNREFIMSGMLPPSPFKEVDLLQVVKKKFNFMSNKLAHVAPMLGCGTKVDTGGFELWLDCMAGDKEAWKKMEEYNRQDVLLLEEMYEKIRPWIPSHPNFALYQDDTAEPICPKCGGKVVRNGHDYTAVSKFQRYMCTSCGTNSRSRKNVIDRGDMLTTIAGN